MVRVLPVVWLVLFVVQVALVVGWYAVPTMAGVPWFVIFAPLLWGVAAMVLVVLVVAVSACIVAYHR